LSKKFTIPFPFYKAIPKGKRADALSGTGVTMLENVDGKSVVEQMSPQFLEFLLDAYRSLKYMR